MEKARKEWGEDHRREVWEEMEEVLAAYSWRRGVRST